MDISLTRHNKNDKKNKNKIKIDLHSDCILEYAHSLSLHHFKNKQLTYHKICITPLIHYLFFGLIVRQICNK